VQLRIFLPGIIWLSFMLLIFISPIDFRINYYGIPSRSIIHTFLFWGITHFTIGSLKKQWDYEVLRRNCYWIVLLFSFSLILFSEACYIYLGFYKMPDFRNIVFDLFGVIIGFSTFRLLYRC
jgi:hypothetical protein